MRVSESQKHFRKYCTLAIGCILYSGEARTFKCNRVAHYEFASCCFQLHQHRTTADHSLLFSSHLFVSRIESFRRANWNNGHRKRLQHTKQLKSTEYLFRMVSVSLHQIVVGKRQLFFRAWRVNSERAAGWLMMLIGYYILCQYYELHGLFVWACLFSCNVCTRNRELQFFLLFNTRCICRAKFDRWDEISAPKSPVTAVQTTRPIKRKWLFGELWIWYASTWNGFRVGPCDTLWSDDVSELTTTATRNKQELVWMLITENLATMKMLTRQEWCR